VPVAFNIFAFGPKTQQNTDGSDGKFASPLHLVAHSLCVMVTADGQVLARSTGGPNSAQSAFKIGMEKWQQLPAARRRPGAVVIAPMRDRPPLAPLLPPPGGLVLRVYARNLKRDAKGELALIKATDIKDKARYPNWDIAYTEPVRDNLWLTESEWKSLLPARPRKGDKIPVPAGIRDRIFLYHLMDNTHGDTGPWERKNLRAGELTLTVEALTPSVRLRMDGKVVLAETPETKIERGFDARFQGYLDYDPSARTIIRFCFLAVGDCWGGGRGSNRFGRPGRTPLAIAFELAAGDLRMDRIPPVLAGGNVSSGYTGNYFFADKRSVYLPEIGH
jgi:hypothetical protein